MPRRRACRDSRHLVKPAVDLRYTRTAPTFSRFISFPLFLAFRRDVADIYGSICAHMRACWKGIGLAHEKNVTRHTSPLQVKPPSATSRAPRYSGPQLRTGQAGSVRGLTPAGEERKPQTVEQSCSTPRRPTDRLHSAALIFQPRK